MPEIVADATVLIFLGKLRRLAWLRQRADLVLIPPVMYEAVVVRGGNGATRTPQSSTTRSTRAGSRSMIPSQRGAGANGKGP